MVVFSQKSIGMVVFRHLHLENSMPFQMTGNFLIRAIENWKCMVIGTAPSLEF